MRIPRIQTILTIFASLIVPYSLVVHRFSVVEQQYMFINERVIDIESNLLSVSIEDKINYLIKSNKEHQIEYRKNKIHTIKDIHEIDKRLFFIEKTKPDICLY